MKTWIGREECEGQGMMVNKGGLRHTSCAVCKKLVCLLGVVIRVREKDSCVEGSNV